LGTTLFRFFLKSPIYGVFYFKGFDKPSGY